MFRAEGGLLGSGMGQGCDGPLSICPHSTLPHLSTLTVPLLCSPLKVWEVKAADLSISPVYKAGCGLVDPSKGISIRCGRSRVKLVREECGLVHFSEGISFRACVSGGPDCQEVQVV